LNFFEFHWSTPANRRIKSLAVIIYRRRQMRPQLNPQQLASEERQREKQRGRSNARDAQQRALRSLTAATAAAKERSPFPVDWERRRYLTIKEAQAAIPASHDLVYRLIKAGRLEVRKLGRRTLVSVASIVRLHDSLPRAEIDHTPELTAAE
jgi:hypothetical protein